MRHAVAMGGVRIATADDLESISALTKRRRHRLAAWSPTWWRVAEGADELHPLWLGHLVGAEGPVVRVVEDDGEVVGCAISMPQRGQWFVDDVALAHDDRWPTAGAALLTAVTERPALTCVPTADHAGGAAMAAAGIEHVSSYWIGVPADGPGLAASSRVDVPPGPPHTFGGPLDPAAPGAIVLSAGDGVAVGSPPLPPPPVYGDGSTVCIVDRLGGADAATLLAGVSAAANARGDKLVCVVAAPDDEQLQSLLTAAGFDRTVDVHRWPT